KTMTLWGLCVLTTVGLASAEGTQQIERKDSCKNFVQQFYNWYVSNAQGVHDIDPLNRAMKEKATVFESELLKQLKEDRDAAAKVKNEIVGLDFDPILNTQESVERYTTGDVKLKKDKYLVQVYDTLNGKKSKTAIVIPELAYNNGQWQFVNFHYGNCQNP